MPEKKVTIGLIQTSVSEDLDLNLKRTMEKVKEAASKGAQIVCLQELFRTRYFPQWDQKDAASPGGDHSRSVPQRPFPRWPESYR